MRSTPTQHTSKEDQRTDCRAVGECSNKLQAMHLHELAEKKPITVTGLSTELIWEISKHLDKEGLANLRLSSKLLAFYLVKPLIDRITTPTFLLTEHGLQLLDQISRYKEFQNAGYKELTICLPLPSDYFNKPYDAEFKRQTALITSSPANRARFEACLKRLPRCTTITITAASWSQIGTSRSKYLPWTSCTSEADVLRHSLSASSSPYYLQHKLLSSSLQNCTTILAAVGNSHLTNTVLAHPGYSTDWEESTHTPTLALHRLLAFLLQCISSAGVRLSGFNLTTLLPYDSNGLDFLRPVLPAAKEVFSTVKHLKLEFNKTAAREGMAPVQRMNWTLLFPLLERLALSHLGELDVAVLSRPDTTFSRLRRLEMAAMEMRQGDFVGFVRRHGGTLEEVEVGRLYLMGMTVGGWRRMWEVELVGWDRVYSVECRELKAPWRVVTLEGSMSEVMEVVERLA